MPKIRDMQNISASSGSPVTVRNTSASAPSLLRGMLPELVGQLERACEGEAELVPYRVRQALDAGALKQLLPTITAMPQSEQTYTRHILHADPSGRFTVVALMWGAQQFSPVHAHHTWCAYRVLDGQLAESHFEWDRKAGQAYLFNKVSRRAGDSVCGHAGLELIHRLGNETAMPAVSIHAYGIEAQRISTGVNRVLPSIEHL